jgi:hypothetical protein
LHVALHTSEEEAVNLSRPCFDRVTEYLKKYRRPGSRIPDLDTLKREKLAVIGTPEDACEIFREYAGIGVSHVICMVNFGGMPMADVRRTLELMAREVFPRLG